MPEATGGRAQTSSVWVVCVCEMDHLQAISMDTHIEIISMCVCEAPQRLLGLLGPYAARQARQRFLHLTQHPSASPLRGESAGSVVSAFSRSMADSWTALHCTPVTVMHSFAQVERDYQTDCMDLCWSQNFNMAIKKLRMAFQTLYEWLLSIYLSISD